MLRHPTIDQLYGLGLIGMAQALQDQGRDPNLRDLVFEDRLALLVEREIASRDTKRTAIRLRKAKLRVSAVVEDIDYHAPRGLDRTLVARIAACQWIGDARNLLVTGKTGTGKTWLACAFGHAACRHNLSVLYARTPRLLEELVLARADGRYPRLLKTLAKVNLLILDDWGVAPMAAEQRRHLLEVIDDRVGRSATLITSQFAVNHWHQLIGDATLADAILDRLVHNAYRIDLDGESMRRCAADTVNTP